MKALLLALKPKKGSAPPSSSPDMGGEDEEEGPESGEGGDYKQLAKDAAADGDWEAMVDALCSYIDAKG